MLLTSLRKAPETRRDRSGLGSAVALYRWVSHRQK